MAESTTSTFGSNSRVLSRGNGIIINLAGGPKPAIVLDCNAAGPTAIQYIDANASPPGVYIAAADCGLTEFPFNATATSDSQLGSAEWMCVKAPPVR
jgi:hypothetical protein